MFSDFYRLAPLNTKTFAQHTLYAHARLRTSNFQMEMKDFMLSWKIVNARGTVGAIVTLTLFIVPRFFDSCVSKV